MQKIQILGALLLVPTLALAQAFETVDTMRWPSMGGFPAYPRDEPRPIRLWAQSGVMRDSNVLRLQGQTSGETIGRIGVGGHYEQRIYGRQRLVLDGRTDAYGYYNFDQLNHYTYLVNGSWAWEIGNDLAGLVTVGRENRFVDIGESQEARRDSITDTRAAFTAAYAVGPSFRLRGGAGIAEATRETRPDFKVFGATLTAGAEYVSPLRNTLGFEYRDSFGDAPVPEHIVPVDTFVNNDFREKELALIATYRPQPGLLSEFRLGRTQHTYTEFTSRNFVGTTYRTHVEYGPGMKTVLVLDAYKEPRAILDIAATHTLVTGLAFGPNWAVTEKVVLMARYVRERRQFEGDPQIVLLGFALRDELVHTWRFGVGWEPERHWQVSTGLDFGSRASNTVGRAYHYTAVSANLAYRFY